MNVKIHASWKAILDEEFKKDYFNQLVDIYKSEKKNGKTIFPPGPFIFNAFERTPFEKVKVVIIGQDPYHGIGQAHGLSFSVPNGIKIPPSLINIFKELKNDVGISTAPTQGNLTHWADQGVLLLNAALTVRSGEPLSHANIGWTYFTDAVIRKISEMKSGVVFLLWGKFANEKKSLIDADKHYILTAAHPSPLSVNKGFFGCKHFSRTNALLMKNGYDPIDWRL